MDWIKKPTLLLDKGKCLANIGMMAAKARQSGVIFRPHFKTHQSREVARWFRESGVTAITVSSVEMARYFADDGWNDITIAFPVNLRQIDEIRNLAETVSLNLLVTSSETTLQLSRLLSAAHPSPIANRSTHIGLFAKIDTGYHRTGLDPSQAEEIASIIKTCESNPGLLFKGFLTHAGHTYHASTPAEIRKIHEHAIKTLATLKSHFANRLSPIAHLKSPIAHRPSLISSTGDTPSSSIVEDLTGADEIRPGNFVFYDVMQTLLGSCNATQIAVCLAAPVVAVHPERHEVIVHAGAIHLSKESVSMDGRNMFGLITSLTPTGWSGPLEGCFVSSLSQEHGILKVAPEATNLFKPGDLAGILPVHSCLTAQAMQAYHYLDGSRIDHM
jgi:D-serine deaminase-like pyridoxal phosphate-dependent protein